MYIGYLITYSLVLKLYTAFIYTYTYTYILFG